MTKFSKILKELRIEFNLSQENLGKNLGVMQSTIAKWESGQREPSLYMLTIIAKFFNVTTDYLLGLEE